jgi:hypothetical protein
MSDDHKGCSGKDLLLPGPELPDGRVPYLRHRGNHEVEAGVMSPLEEGQEPDPDKETFRLKPTGGPFYEVVESRGPSMVNSDAFRSNWDRIFGGQVTTGLA